MMRSLMTLLVQLECPPWRVQVTDETSRFDGESQ